MDEGMWWAVCIAVVVLVVSDHAEYEREVEQRCGRWSEEWQWKCDDAEGRHETVVVE